MFFRLLCFLLPLCHGLQLILEQRTPLLTLAAQNLRRYIHLLDTRHSPIQILSSSSSSSSSLSAVSPRLLFSISPSCPPDQSFTTTALNASCVRLSACDAAGQGAFFAAQDLLHTLGVYFTAEGPPFLPPSAHLHAQLARSGGAAPAPLSAQFSQRILMEAAALKSTAPAFQYRGFQPWGSYPIGNDWWDVDEYRRVVELIVSLKGNWVGMHNYPCGYAFAEPGVWLSEDGNQSSQITPNGNLTPPAAAPPLCMASWASSQRGSWGLFPLPTSSLKFGAAALFDRDCFGNRVLTQGITGVCPLPTDAASNAEAYNRIGGGLYKSVFAFAAQLSVGTALGAEFPLPSSLPPHPPPPPPPPPPSQPLPLRIFWSTGRQDTFVTPTNCAECPPPGSPDAYEVEAPAMNSTVLVLPSPGPGLLPLDCFWWEEGTDAWLGVVAVEKPPSAAYLFVRTEGYVYATAAAGATAGATAGAPKAGEGRVPLLQYARTTYSKPGGLDTWLVVGTEGVIAAAVARGYQPLGMGTPVGWAPLGNSPPPIPPTPTPTPLPPTPPSALSLAIYTDTFTRLQRLYGGNLTWYWAWSAENVQWAKISQSSDMMRGAVSELGVMNEAVKAAGAQFGVALGGWMLGAYDNRTLFDAHAPPDWPLSSLDGYLGESPPDDAFAAMTPGRAQKWSHPWVEDDMDLTAVQQWVGRNLAHAARALELGVTGHASLQWRTRTVAPALTAVARFPFNTSLTTSDFLMGYADAAFGGGGPGAALGALMIQVDSASMPRPVKCDPGCLQPNPSLCGSEAEQAYEFVAQWEGQRGGVEAGGDPSALARFDYTSAHFTQLSAMRAFQCSWGQYLGVLKGVQSLPSGSPAQHAAAVSSGFPAFAALVGNASDLMWAVQEATGSYGDLGVLMQLYGDVEKGAGEGALGVLESLAGGALCGAACHFPEDYSPVGNSSKPPSVRVFTVRTVLQRGEPLNLRAHVLGGSGCASPQGTCAVHVAVLGSSGYEVSVLNGEGVGRAVFAGTIAVPQGGEEEGVQWFVNCTCSGSAPALFPPAAPSLPQTVVFI